LKKAADSGMTTRKIIVTPCMVKNSLYVEADRIVPFGCANWSRMNRASIPPMRKNAKAVMPYRIPIRLWSTVVIQLQNPVVAVGRRSRPPLPPSAGTLTLAIATRPPSLQGHQVGDERPHLLVAKPVVRHPRPRLHLRRILQPPLQVRLVHGEDTAGETVPAHQVSEVRPAVLDHRVSVGIFQALDRVAGDAPSGLRPGDAREEGLALGRQRAFGRYHRVRLLLPDPSVELGRRLGHDLESHVCVRQAAELGALSRVRSQPVRLQDQVVRAAGDDVLLSGQLGVPERVDHVVPDVAKGALLLAIIRRDLVVVAEAGGAQ